MVNWLKNALILSLNAVCLALVVGGVAIADGTQTVTPLQDTSSITVNGPEGAHVPPMTLFPLFAGDTLTEKVGIGFTSLGTNSGGMECVIDSKTFSYANVTVSYSPNGTTWYTPGHGGTGSASFSPPDPSGNSVLTATFPLPGYYQITYNAHVAWTSKTCGDGSQVVV